MKKTMIASFCMVFTALLLILMGLNLPEESAPPALDPVLLLTENDTGAYLLQLRLGAQAALDELDCELITEVVGPEDPSSAWSGRSFSGALVCIGDESLRSLVLDALDASGLPSAVIGVHDKRRASVFQDEAQLGESAAALAAGYEKAAPVGGTEEARRAASDRLGERADDESGIDPFRPDHCLIALDGETALRLCAEKAEHGWQCALLAADPGESRAQQLESGTVQALLLPSPYAVGYRAASEALWGRPTQTYRMPFFTVTQETMYDAQNVKLVFPLLN